jgi:replicative DNA helicase
MTEPNTIGRVPPQNLDAEASVLGAILVENETISRALEVLKPEDFYRQSHAKIFRAMMELSERTEPIDLITLTERLTGSGDLASIGGASYIASLAESTPTAANIKYYCRIVKEAADKRNLLLALRETADAIYSSADDLMTIVGRLSSYLSHLSDGTSKNFRSIDDFVIETLQRIKQAHERGSLVTGIPTGFRLYDQGLGGIHPGELVIIAGRPSMGKTAFAGDVAKGAAERGYGVAFVTAESPAREIIQRLIARATGIENRDLRRGKLEDRDFPMLVARSGILGKLPIWFLQGEQAWDRIKAKIRSLKLKQPNISLIIVDYVGLLSASLAKGGERYLEIGRISAEAKNLATELEAGFVLLSQLNRVVELRGDGRPKMSDLRESGNLEQDADVVGLLYREYKYNENADNNRAELMIAKARNDDIGKIPLRFDDRTVSFSDWIDRDIITAQMTRMMMAGNSYGENRRH